MPELTFWPKRILLTCFHYLLWSALSVVYWGKRKTIPSIKNPLLLSSATHLAKEIREGKLKSRDVVQAYIDRILEVNPYINAIVQDRFHDALEDAEEVDRLVASREFTKEQLEQEKPLLGVPFTVKVLLTVAGLRCTSASLLFKDRIAESDAPTVFRLKRAGGIVLATTNSAEFGSSIETNNLLHGTTCNPYDTTRTSGGSSGGESALLGAAGSVIGLGNDLLGSVRIPSHFCCLFAHKATVDRISNRGSVPSPHPSCDSMLYTGPMCRYAEDVFTMVNVLTSDQEKKMKSIQQIDFKNLKIYYQTGIRHAWIYPTDKDIIQAIVNATSHFKKNYGAEVKEIQIPLLTKSNRVAMHGLQGNLPNVISWVTYGLVPHLNGYIESIKCLFRKCSFTFMCIVATCFGKSYFFFNQKEVTFYKEIEKKLEDEFDDLLDENSVFFYPTCPTYAPYHNEIYALLPSTAYTSVFNCVGLPSTQCPLGLNSKGMPIGMQIIGRKDNDALTIACAIELEKVFGGWIPPENTCNNNNK